MLGNQCLLTSRKSPTSSPTNFNHGANVRTTTTVAQYHEPTAEALEVLQRVVVQMARPSKTKFPIYEDSGIPTPEPECIPNDDPFTDKKDRTIIHEHELNDDGSILPSIEESVANIQPTDTEIDKDDRRESAISSMPESSTETDQEQSLPHSTIRPSFRRHLAGSPFDKSPKRSGLYPRSRTATPRSARSKGSPLPRKQTQEEAVEAEKKEYPLVLLHISILPVELRWSAENMREILSPETVENVQLLRSRLSETILQRGILIPHPREEYDLLEERLLEALELRKERITKCGHFRARESMSSISSAEESISSGDSGMGSSIEDLCAICHDHIRPKHAESRLSKWNIKVYASNGLMKASAWTAAWSEMERVDVEIVPNIDESLCRLLDAKTVEEEAEKKLQQEEARIAHEQKERAYDEEYQRHANFTREILYLAQAPTPSAEEPPSAPPVPHETKPTVDDLPQVYRPKDIPLSLLLRNYIILLAQDTKNLIIFVLAVVALWLGLNAVLSPTIGIASPAVLHPNTSSAHGVVDLNNGLDVSSLSAEILATHSSERPEVAVTESPEALQVEDNTAAPDDLVDTAELNLKEPALLVSSSETEPSIVNSEDLFEVLAEATDGETTEPEHDEGATQMERDVLIRERSNSFEAFNTQLVNMKHALDICANEAIPSTVFSMPGQGTAGVMTSVPGSCENSGTPERLFAKSAQAMSRV